MTSRAVSCMQSAQTIVLLLNMTGGGKRARLHPPDVVLPQPDDHPLVAQFLNAWSEPWGEKQWEEALMGPKATADILNQMKDIVRSKGGGATEVRLVKLAEFLPDFKAMEVSGRGE